VPLIAWVPLANSQEKEFPMRVHLSVRDLATILAALRYWQQDLADNEAAGEGPISPHFDDDVTPLSVEEIDELCERLNCDSD